MIISTSSIFSKKVSTFLSLLIIFILALTTGAIIIWQAQKLATLQRPSTFLISFPDIADLENYQGEE